MLNAPSFFILIIVITGALGFISIAPVFQSIQQERSRFITLVSVFPSLILLLLFYSFAIHMYQSFDGWPPSIGNRGFSESLNLHANVTVWYFTALIWINLFMLPVVFLAFLIFKNLRKNLFYLGIYAAASAFSFIMISIAPSGFLNWWWD